MVQEMNKALSKQRSSEIKAATPKGVQQWNEAPAIDGGDSESIEKTKTGSDKGRK
jgi:hypothetical protein